ncbi:MAG: hypothetical protein D6767_10690, partial [Candidatus Hydrogenedentota bacterium]
MKPQEEELLRLLFYRSEVTPKDISREDLITLSGIPTNEIRSVLQDLLNKGFIFEREDRYRISESGYSFAAS